MKKAILLAVVVLAISTLAFAEETLTITTYYPSPYGVYNELRSTKIAIGDNYIQGSDFCWTGGCPTSGLIDPSADLVVEQNVGIGTVKPLTTLHVLKNYTYANAPALFSRYPFPGQLILDAAGHRLYLGAFWGGADGYEASAIQASSHWPDNAIHPGRLLLNPVGGNVGIGTMEPTEKLTVEGGNVKITSLGNGTSTRPVVADASGVLSAPSGGASGDVNGDGVYNYKDLPVGSVAGYCSAGTKVTAILPASGGGLNKPWSCSCAIGWIPIPLYQSNYEFGYGFWSCVKQ